MQRIAPIYARMQYVARFDWPIKWWIMRVVSVIPWLKCI